MSSFKRWIALVTILLTVTSCSQQTYEINYLKNGEVNYRWSLLFSKQDLNYLDNYEIDNARVFQENPLLLLKEVNAVYTNRGFSITEINDELQFGVTYEKRYSSTNDFHNELEELFSSEWSGLQITMIKSKNIQETSYTTTGKLYYWIDAETRKVLEQIEDVESLMSTPTAKATLIISQPGELVAQVGGSVVDNGVQFELPLTLDSTVYTDPKVRTRKRTFFETLEYPVGFLIGLGVVGYGGYYLYAKKKNEQNSRTSSE